MLLTRVRRRARAPAPAVGNLTSLANRTNAQGIYHDTKEYL